MYAARELDTHALNRPVRNGTGVARCSSVAAGKLAPKKYGDRLEVDGKGLAFQPAVLVQIGGVGEPAKTIEHDDGDGA